MIFEIKLGFRFDDFSFWTLGYGGFPKLGRYFFVGHHNMDYSIFGSILGFL